MTAFTGLPGRDLIEQGLADLEAERDTEAALLVSIGAPRLTSLGVRLPRAIPEPEHRLYTLLSERHGDAAHSRYNALIRRLVSFERALGRVRSHAEGRSSPHMTSGAHDKKPGAP